MGFAGARVGFPVDALQRIAGAVVAQPEEFLGIADRGGERDAAVLVAARPGQRERRQRIAPRQHDEVRLRGTGVSALMSPSGSARATVTPRLCTMPRLSACAWTSISVVAPGASAGRACSGTRATRASLTSRFHAR